MTLPELLYFLLIIGCAVVTVIWVSAHYGIFYGILGAVLVIGIIVVLSHSIIYLYYFIFPIRPICKRGVCKSNDYEWVGINDDKDIILRCNCGNIYLKKDDRVIEMLPNGSMKPYMIQGFFGTWKPDGTELPKINLRPVFYKQEDEDNKKYNED